MRLHRLLPAVPDAHVNGSLDVDIRDVAYDSRRVMPGSLFVAVPSLRSQVGTVSYIDAALTAGAVAVVTEENLVLEDVATIQVPDARLALADLATQFFGRPSQSLQLYGVTGTDGKTTTAYLLEQILAFAGLRTGLVGTVEQKVAEQRESNVERMTTPESLDLQRLLRRMVDVDVTHAVIEVSSHGLALHRVRGCCFAACAVTNITRDHVEFHGSWETYFETKASLFTELAVGRPAIINADDENCMRLAARLHGQVVTYGLDPHAQLRAADVVADDQGSRFTVHAGKEDAQIRLPLLGPFNVSNALAAVALALTAGLPLQTIAQGLSTAQPPPGRLQRLLIDKPFEVVVDYAHTVNAFRSVLASLRRQVEGRGRLIAVFGSAGDRDREKRPVLAQIALQHADFFYITNEDPYREQAQTIIEEIASGLPRSLEGHRYECVLDRGQAIQRAIARARPGDLIAILGKGHEQSIVVNGHREPWNDATAVSEALKAHA